MTLRPLAAVCISPVDRADTGHSVIVTDTLSQEPVSDLPGKHGGVLPLVVANLLHHLGGGHLGLGATNHPRPDAASLVVPTPLETEDYPGGRRVSGHGLALSPHPLRLLGVGRHPGLASDTCCPVAVSPTWTGCAAAQPDLTPGRLLPPFPPLRPGSCV